MLLHSFQIQLEIKVALLNSSLPDIAAKSLVLSCLLLSRGFRIPAFLLAGNEFFCACRFGIWHCKVSSSAVVSVFKSV